MANPSSDPYLPLNANEVWNNQERNKGKNISQATSWILTHDYGGWLLNLDWTVFDQEGANPHFPGPDETNQISNPELKVKPFFDDTKPTELYGPNGSAYAGAHGNTLLAQMVPCLSFAAGSNAIDSLNDNNIDMMTMKNGWPTSRTNDYDWHHGDIREVAYFYTCHVFDKFVTIGNLDQ